MLCDAVCLPAAEPWCSCLFTYCLRVLFVKLNFLITANLINHVVQTKQKKQKKQKKTFARNILKWCFDGFLPPQMEDGRFCTLCSNCSHFKRLDNIHFSSLPCCLAAVPSSERWSPVSMCHDVVPPAVEVLAWWIFFFCGSVVLSLISYGHLFVRHSGEIPCAVGCIHLSLWDMACS